MKILHTSDWHLGKTLNNITRYEEQQEFIDEIAEIAKDENVDIILISGDIYDTSNPSAMAENMFFNSAVRLAQNGKTPVMVIAGNHDSPDRLLAGADILKPYGVFISGRPFDFNINEKYNGYEITAENGTAVINKNGETAVIALLPYVTDRRIDEIIGKSDSEEENAESYSDKIAELLSKLSERFENDTINIVMAHLYTLGGKESGSERSIQLGGSYSVKANAFPEKAQYIALGHLHRPQTVSGTDKRAYYSGSPLPYSKEEAVYSKAVNIVEIHAGEKAEIKSVPISSSKPIEIWKMNSVAEAIDKCRENSGRSCYVYIEIKTDRVISLEEIHEMKLLKKDIMDIVPIMENDNDLVNVEEREELLLKDSFVDFYKKLKGAEPNEEITELFLSVFGEDGEVK